MQEYLLKIIGISCVISAVCMITPQNGRKYTKLVCTLSLLCVILSPLSDNSLWDLSDKLSVGMLDGEQGENAESIYEEIYNNTISRANEEKICVALKELMARDIGLSLEDFDVEVVTATDKGYIEVAQARVILRGSAVSHNPYEIIAYLEDMLECECSIVYY